VTSIFFHVNAADPIDRFFQSILVHYGDLFHEISRWLLLWILNPVEFALKAVPPVVIILAMGLASWLGTRRVGAPVLMMV
jgi:glycine betaine/proline transport system permease protein